MCGVTKFDGIRNEIIKGTMNVGEREWEYVGRRG